MIFLTIILAVFFAVNMGGATFASSFASAYGGKVLSRRRSALLFALFVVLGACFGGEHVSTTLGKDIVPPEMLTPRALAVLLLMAGLSMYSANLMHIPQSTSLVTVAAIAGVGAATGSIRAETIYFFIPFWLALPILSFFVTRLVAGYVYPPRRSNFWVYEKFVNQRKTLKRLVLVAACYNAFSVGTNNVANVAGPMVNIKHANMFALLFVFGVVYGLGSLFFSGPLKTAGNKIVPLGVLTAAIIAFVSGTLMLIASGFGVPQSFVMIQMGSLFAISSLKHGTKTTFNNPLTLKTFYTWTINPVVTFFLTWIIAVQVLK